MKVIYELRLTNDRVLTVIVGRFREPIDLLGKERGQIFDAVKWSLISKDAYHGERTAYP